jgi:predicted nucleotide-binding protein (sugar kinase/HSP70/actin superfamily)
MTRIGIPRALIFYKHEKLWPAFFSALGFEVVESGKTNGRTLRLGLGHAEDETCLPVKVFIGHCLELGERAPLVFIPRYRKLYKNRWGCPKFFGLPDVVRASLGIDVLDCFVDGDLGESMRKLGFRLTGSRAKARVATAAALQEEARHGSELTDEYKRKINSKKEKILLIGHAYNIYDDYVNLDIRKLLSERRVEVIPSTVVPFEYEQRFSRWDYPMYWDFGVELWEQLRVALPVVDGVVQLSTFACGPDTFLTEFFREETQKYQKPFMQLVFDEGHSPAWAQTRVETFIDTIRMRK